MKLALVPLAAVEVAHGGAWGYGVVGVTVTVDCFVIPFSVAVTVAVWLVVTSPIAWAVNATPVVSGAIVTVAGTVRLAELLLTATVKGTVAAPVRTTLQVTSVPVGADAGLHLKYVSAAMR